MSQLGFDPDALREKYREERDKRLRADGNEQYVEVDGEFAHYLDDPYVEPGSSASRCTDEVDVRRHRRRLRRAAGRRAAARGRRRGHPHRSRRAATSAAPGTGTATRARRATSSPTSTCRCSRSSATCRRRSTSQAPEILEHSRAIGEHFDLYRDACFQTEVTELRWDDDDARWIVSTNRGDAHAGALRVPWRTGRCTGRSCRASRASTTSQGHTFHTSRWDYDYTGGDSRRRPRPGSRDKRVGIIGTGATAVQCVPAPRRVAPSSSTCSSARRRRSTCATTGRPIPSGPQSLEPGLAAAADGQLQQPRLGRLAGRGPRRTTAGPTSSASS